MWRIETTDIFRPTQRKEDKIVRKTLRKHDRNCLAADGCAWQTRKLLSSFNKTLNMYSESCPCEAQRKSAIFGVCFASCYRPSGISRNDRIKTNWQNIPFGIFFNRCLWADGHFYSLLYRWSFKHNYIIPRGKTLSIE